MNDLTSHWAFLGYLRTIGVSSWQRFLNIVLSSDLTVVDTLKGIIRQ